MYKSRCATYDRVEFSLCFGNALCSAFLRWLAPHTGQIQLRHVQGNHVLFFRLGMRNNEEKIAITFNTSTDP